MRRLLSISKPAATLDPKGYIGLQGIISFGSFSRSKSSQSSSVSPST